MNWFAHLILIAWVPLVLLALGSLPPRRALLVTLVGGWLFLPVAGFEHVTGYQTKHMILSVGLLAAALRYAPAPLWALRPRRIDLPMAVFCLEPLVTALANGMGAYEGFAAVLANVLTWGVPWVVGRAYFSDLAGPRQLAGAIVVGGLVYAPLCLWEYRMSPQLHATFYGFHQHDFIQTVRAGSWRPMVFMHHGLMVALWMAAATLVALWLWRRGEVRTLGRVPISWITLALLGTTILTKSVGALVLLAVGAGAVFVTPRTGRIAVLSLALVAPAYMTFRAAGSWSGDLVVKVASVVTTPDRVESLAFRLRNEETLVAKALQRPALGWGRYARWFVYDEDGHAAVPDGLWIIVLGSFGVVGLVAYTAALLLPAVRFASRVRRPGANPVTVPAMALAILLCLFAVDCLFNAMINPVYVVAAGGLAGLDVAALQRSGARRRAARPGREVAVAALGGAS